MIAAEKFSAVNFVKNNLKCNEATWNFVFIDEHIMKKLRY